MSRSPAGRSDGGPQWMGSLFSRPSKSSRRRAADRRGKRVLALERLEPLLMLHADLGHDPALGDHGLQVYEAIDVQAAIRGQAIVGEGGGGGGSFANLPVLNSLAGAAQSLYLDFDGHFDAVWGGYTNVTTPVFDKDGDPATLSSNEVATIEEIWARVAEDYAPFKINVTTVDPGDFSNGKALRVAIGGDGSWIGPYGGVAYVNAFTNSIVNTAYVFSKNLGNGNARYVAEASSHESGHAFGLMHQSSYNSSGQKTAEYNAGNASWAPIMGASYSAARSTWHNGQTTSASTYQDDMAVISRSANVFGYRADDAGDNTLGAKAVSVNGSQISASGIISKTTDVDYHSFATAGGTVAVTLSVASVGPNLDSVLELRNFAGQVVASANPANSLSASITASLVAGLYYLVARGTGQYGSVGQYSIAGSVPPATGGGGGTGGGSTTPSLTIGDVSMTEGNSGNRLAYFTVRLSAPSSSVVTVQYATANGSASSSTDYFSTSGTLTFSAGQTSKQVGVYVRGDTTVEADEKFYVDLRSANGATIADSRGEGLIVNDDGTVPAARTTAVGLLVQAQAGGAAALDGARGAEAGAPRSAALSVDRLFALLGRGETNSPQPTLPARNAAVAGSVVAAVDRALASPSLDDVEMSDLAAVDDAFAAAGLHLTGSGPTGKTSSLPAAFDWLAGPSLSADVLRGLVEA